MSSSRADALAAAVRLVLEEHRAAVNAAADLHTVTIEIKFEAGTDKVRGTRWSEERLARQRSRTGSPEPIQNGTTWRPPGTGSGRG